MPTVEMPVSQASSGGGKQGFGTGLPTPVLLIAVGGGIGLVVFLMKRSGTPSSGQSGDKGTLLPNTAIMLGSLQQGILQLQGDVTMGNADLSSQLTGVGENLSSQIDMQSAQWQQAFADLNTYLGGNFTSIQSSEASIATAIAGLGTQNAGLADSLTSILSQLYNANSGITALGGQITGVNLGLTAGLNSLGQQITGVSGQIQTSQGQLIGISSGIQAIQNWQNGQQLGSSIPVLASGTWFRDLSSGTIGRVTSLGGVQMFATQAQANAAGYNAAAWNSIVNLPTAQFNQFVQSRSGAPVGQ
jgi:hypothetical protein